MTDLPSTPTAQVEPPDETPDLSSAASEVQSIANPASEPLDAAETSGWDTAIRYMAYLGGIAILTFLIYVAVIFNRVNQWQSVTESFANNALQVRISYPQNVGRDETSRLHVVVENTGQETLSNLRLGFTSNGIARFKDSEALFAELPAKAQRNTTLEYTIDNASAIRDSDIQLTAFLYYITATLPVTGTVLSTTLHTIQTPQAAAFSQPIVISVNPDREYYLEAEEFWSNASAKLPAIIVSIISAIAAFVSINIQGGPGKILQWLVRPPTTNKGKGEK